MANNPNGWPRWAKPFLVALTVDGIVSHAAKAAGVDRVTAYRLRKANADFATAWEEAEYAGTETLVEEAYRRAVKGYEEEVLDKEGKVIGGRRMYSDNMLGLLLKAKRPAQFRERQSLDVTSSGKELQALTLDGLADTDKREILKLAYESTFDAAK